ncbi:MAG TPA: hypothetical protein VJQ83_00925 [Tepidiformaceae bacterium]|nr:hypothetical protein [Tepidiformaceae bacterium]
MRLELEVEGQDARFTPPGDGATLAAFLSFAVLRGFGAQHPLLALADRLHDRFHVKFGPLTTFYEAGPEDDEDREKLEQAWQEPGPLREALEACACAMTSDEQCQALLRRADATSLPAQAASLAAPLLAAEQAGARVRMVYTL